MTLLAEPVGNAPPGASWSEALKFGDELIVSGLHARHSGGSVPEGVEAQMRALLNKLDALLDACGGSADNIVKLTIYLTDIADKDAVNRVRTKRFGPVYPCSTLMAVSAFAFPQIEVEIDAVARLDVRLND